MASLRALLLLPLVALVALKHGVVDANYATETYFTAGQQYSAVYNNGNSLALALNKNTASGFGTDSQFLFGSISMMIKLIPGNAAGVVTTFYTTSTGDKHDEIDFEFLGNVSGQPYTIHTNIYTQGVGNKEEQFFPWFDATADFHNYTIFWNPFHVVWFVDKIPIRVFKNYQDQNIPFPTVQPMIAYSSIWNADDWATQGGRLKTNWSCAPFIARFDNLGLDACDCSDVPRCISRCSAPIRHNWYMAAPYRELSATEQSELAYVRDNYMVYNYCTDYARFNYQMGPECSLPQY